MNATASGESSAGHGHDGPLPSSARRARPEERGRLTVDDRVVEKVAGHAVTFVPDAAAAPRRLLGMNVGEAGPRMPQA